MTFTTTRLRLFVLVALLVAGVGLFAVPSAPVAAQTQGDLLFALTDDGRLIQFRSNAPQNVLAERRISGLVGGDMLLSIDFRPATGQMVGISNSSRLYTINPLTGMAMPIGSGPIMPMLAQMSIGFDFNPVPDRLRIVAGNQNLRINPNNGDAIVDGTLMYAANDLHAGRTPMIVAAGYTNNMPRATSTALYVIDAELNILALQSPPNDGVLNTIGSLGVDVDGRTSLDITRNGNVYIAYSAADSMGSMLGMLDLTTGQVMPIGMIGGGMVRSIASPVNFGAFMRR
jgi:hypothetical protein